MSSGDSNSNTAIVALIIVGLAVAAGVFFYYQSGSGTPAVIHKETVIERPVPVPTPEPEEDPGFKFEHEDSEGNKTEIQAP